MKNTLFIFSALTFTLLFSGCFKKSEPDMRAAFKNAISTQTKISFEVTDLQDKNSYSAKFPTASPEHFQAISLIFLKTSCKENTPKDQMKLTPLGFGPNGSSFKLDFCSHENMFSLIDSNRLSEKDSSHGIDLPNLAVEIQKLSKNHEN